MHDAAARWLASLPIDLTGEIVYEVGAYDHNGCARDFMHPRWMRWVGIDLLAGPGVDHVGDAEVILPTLDRCDVLVSTEVLEHSPRWRQLVAAMCNALADGGLLIITCAGPGREPHSADGDGPPHDGEHYANVDHIELADVAALNGVRRLISLGINGDTRYLGRKD
jgi:SAM-dependent methyltransferase